MSILEVAAVPDTHRPFHDPYAWELALQIIEERKPHFMVHLGDLGDFHAVARHPKKFGRAQAFERELEDVQLSVQELAAAAQSSRLRRRYWLQGNHEESFERYVANNAPQLESVVPSGPELLDLPEGDGWVPYLQSMRIGKVQFAHDVGHSGKNAVLQNLDAAGKCIVTGHTHRAGIAWGGHTHADRHFSMSCGWLGDRSKITYMKPTQTRAWQLGIGWVFVDETTHFAWPVFVPFVDYTAVLDGKTYAVKGPHQTRKAA